MKTRLVSLGAVALVIAACGSEGEQSAESQGAVVRQAAVACPEISGSVTQSTRNTTFTVSSTSKRDWTLRATDIDCYDWSGASTPSKLDGVLTAGSTVSSRIEARGACPGSGLPVPLPDRQGRFTLVLERSDSSGLTAKIPIVYQCDDVDSSTGSGTYCDPMLSGAQPVVTDILDANGGKKGIISGSISCDRTESGNLTFRDIP